MTVKKNTILQSIPKETLRNFIFFSMITSVILLYWQIGRHGFINFDDSLYINENYYVRNGLNKESIIWAFTNISYMCWQPITWLSHMFDCQIFGLHAGSHHYISLMIHILNCLLLYKLFYSITGEYWKTLMISAIFALHPINVESVTWAAERKNVLSTLFWLLTLFTYFKYIKKPIIWRYTLTLFCFILGLMTKPMTVTIPFTLFIFDFWPIQRLKFIRKRFKEDLIDRYRSKKYNSNSLFIIIIEKIPFFLILIAYLWFFSFFIQKVGGINHSLNAPMLLRIENAIVSYMTYLIHVFWPVGLTVYYPFPENIPLWQSVGSAIILLSITVFFIKKYKSHPYLISGWVWYLGTLIPVIGLVQSGLWPKMADRWAYVPLIGIYVIISWGVSDLINEFNIKKIYQFSAAACFMIVLAITTWHYISYWKNSVTVFKHAVEVTRNNYIAHDNLGLGLVNQGKLDEAHIHFMEALKIKPDFSKGHHNVGAYFLLKGNIDKAIFHFKKSLIINPNSERVYNNLGRAFLKKNMVFEAIEQFKAALKIKPDYQSAQRNLIKAEAMKMSDQ